MKAQAGAAFPIVGAAVQPIPRRHPFSMPLSACSSSATILTMRRGCRLSVHLLQELEKALKGDMHPVREVAQIIAQFLDGPFQEVKIEQRRQLGSGLRQEGSLPGCF